MAIARLTHLHFSIPSSETTSGPVPPECFLVVPLSRRPAASHRVSFAEDVDVIGSSPFLFLPVGEPESITESALVDPGLLELGDITSAQPTYVLFPTDDPFDDADWLPPPRFPYLLATPGFTPIVRPGDIPYPAGSASLHWTSLVRATPSSLPPPSLPGWYPPVLPCPNGDVLGLPLTISLIDRVPSEDSLEPASSSLVSSEDMDRDARLLASLLNHFGVRIVVT